MYIFLLIFVKGCYNLGASLVAQGKTKRKRKIFLQMKEMWIQSLDQEDLWEEEIATHSNSLLWAIPWTEEPGGLHFSSVQSLSRVRLFATPWTAAFQASLSITNSQSLPKLMSIELVTPSNHLILCHPLLLPPSIKMWSTGEGNGKPLQYSCLRSPWTAWKGLYLMGLQK